MIYENSYKSLLAQIINNGNYRQDRTGVGTRSLFNQTLNITMHAEKELGKEIITGENFPILNSKHKTQMNHLLF